MAIQLKFINQVILFTFIAALLILIVSFFLQHSKEGWAVLVGASWASANLLFLRQFFEKLLLQKGKKITLILVAFMKWPILYAAGYMILKTHFFPTVYLLMGVSLKFVAVVTLGVLTNLQQNEN